MSRYVGKQSGWMSGCLCDLPLAGRHFDCRGQWGEPRATWSSHGRCVQMDCGDNAGYRRKTRQGIVEQSSGDNTRYRGKPRRGVVEQGALSGVGAILQRAGHGKSAGRRLPPFEHLGLHVCYALLTGRLQPNACQSPAEIQRMRALDPNEIPRENP